MFVDRRTPALAITALVLGLAAWADDDQTKPAQSLQYDVVVTATKVDTPSREVASSVTVITEQELVRSRRSSVLEALNDLIGLSAVQNGGPGAVASVFIRGANSEHMLVLVTGSRSTTPSIPPSPATWPISL
jgi:vitamin B12 transporter